MTTSITAASSSAPHRSDNEDFAFAAAFNEFPPSSDPTNASLDDIPPAPSVSARGAAPRLPPSDAPTQKHQIDKGAAPEPPAPLSSHECNLRGLSYFPWHGAILQASAFNATVTDAEYRGATNLWWAAWNQHPAGSLPDDDRQLCRLAGKGDGRAAMTAWLKIKAGALYGFVMCSDGRLYHPFLCEQAKIAMSTRVAARTKANADNVRKQRERENRQHMFERLATVGVVPAWNVLTRDLRDLYKKYFGEAPLGE